MKKKILAAGLTAAVVLGLVLVGLAFAQLVTPSSNYNGYTNGQGNGMWGGHQVPYGGPYNSGQQPSTQPPAIGAPQYPGQGGFQLGFGRGCWGW